ncbi:tRNA 2-thiocytidine(32) synthetase TtcA [Colwelliaceae bacterium BS250]
MLNVLNNEESSPTPTSVDKITKQQLAKLEKRFRHHVGKAIFDYNMIEDGDKVMVCLSGGADSYTMLDILLKLRRSAPIHFDIIAVNLDQKQPGFPEHILPEYLQQLGIEYHVIEEDTYSIVMDKIPEGKTTCSLCSRLRRGILYSTAKKLNATKIALGHHRDDMIETLLLNMFFNGKTKTMPAKLVSDNGEHVVIRPLAYCKEKEIKQYSALKQFPIIPCNLCGSQPNMQRQNVKKMLSDWDKQFPGRAESIFTAMQNVVPSHLCDHQLFNFKDVDLTTGVINGGDLAFDSEPSATDFSHSVGIKVDDKDLLNIIEIK